MFTLPIETADPQVQSRDRVIDFAQLSWSLGAKAAATRANAHRAAPYPGHAGGLGARQQVADALFDGYVDLLRAPGLLRTGDDRQIQLYVLNALGARFFVTAPLLPPPQRDAPPQRHTAALGHAPQSRKRAPLAVLLPVPVHCAARAVR